MRILIATLFLFLSGLALAQTDAGLVAARSSEFERRIGDLHPRLLVTPADLPALRAFLGTLPSLPDGAAQAKLILPPLDNRPLVAEPQAARNGTPEGTRLWEAGYKAATQAGSWAQRYALAWLLSEDPAYGREAARWLLHLASWRITLETYRTNDELFIQHLRPMIFAYDWAYGALTPDERDTISRALGDRLQILSGQIQPKFSLTQPTPPDNSLSHPMRFISTLGQGGLALLHQDKRAAGWLAWSYEYYLRQFPVWGGPAGGWAEGLNYWNTGISQHQRFLEGMALLGFREPLARSFWRNTPYFGIYSLMPYPGSSFGDLTNLMPPSGSIRLMMEKFAVLNGDPYPLAYANTLQNKLPADFNYYTYDGIDAFLQRFRTTQAKLPAASLADLPQSRYFNDIGVVTMHAALGDAAHDIMLGFRSSPQGSASHGFSDQNSFVLNAFGQPLAINSGYREYYDSAHHVGWSRQTRSKNALLFGGQGQRIKDASATGTITRFVDGADFTFATGAATRAYAPHAERALRHVFFVNRRYFVMLDEARAPAPVQFQWNLHARSAMQITPERAEITQQQKDARLTVRFLHPAADTLAFRQTDLFDPPVLAAYQAKMPNEWHVTAETKTAAKQQDFLTLLYPWQTAPDSPAPPASQTLPATKGYAMRLSGQGAEDVVLMAREDEKQAEAGGWRISGMAASFNTRGDTLRFNLVATDRLDGPLSLHAPAPLDLAGVRNANGLSLSAELPGPMRLEIAPGFSAKTVTGAAAWQSAADGRLVLQLPAGPLRVEVRP